LVSVYKQGDAREESYYPALKKLFESYAEYLKRRNISITVLPKKTEAGNPDFRVWDGKQKVVGYIEAKAPSADLDKIEHSEQLKRYITTFPNVILTNFFEFRLYRNDNEIARATLAYPNIMQLGQLPPIQDEEGVNKLLGEFFSFSLPKIYNAKNLAIELAKRTRFLRDEIVAEELKEESEGEGTILDFYNAFKEYLISDLTKESFADLYAQTITYGLFAARTRSNGEFNRKLAYDLIPKSIGILSDVFRFVSLGSIPQQMEWAVDDIAEVLATADVKKILEKYYHDGKGSDPIIHFYETFLSEYDPKTREKRGVYYTPEPVVSYIVRSLNIILKEKFDKPDGFANEGVTVLDPAAGTMTFLAQATQLAVEEYKEKYGEGGVSEFIKEHVLKNFYAFELMMAPYAIGHMKMSFFLEELGHKLEDNERFKLYLTNTLEMKELEQTRLPGTASLSKESHLAGEVKKNVPILVILGNPPYSGHSSNNSEWISREIKEYYKVDGKPLNEKNPKWLQDDYVKFIRFAQWKIDKAGNGIVGFVTNHSYLENPTFRGMRQSLMNTFDEIYILDLHGNSRKKEKCPDGSKDQNIFDIQQGVSIVFLIKNGNDAKTIKHADLWGLREEKYKWLSNNDISTTNWKEIEPRSPMYFFVSVDQERLELYEKYPKINEIFPINSVGIVTARDKLTIHFSADNVWHTVKSFTSLDPELARTAFGLGKDSRDWKVCLAQEDLQNSGPDKSKVVPILYRPFDIRYTYYTGKSSGFHCRPRPEVMKHMLKENIALITVRKAPPNSSCGFFMVTDVLISTGVIRSDNQSVDYLLPLYVYPDENENKMFSGGKTPNIDAKVFTLLTQTYGKRPAPEEVFNYIYAVFYSNIYREKYAEFLKTDFPRVPFTRDYELFKTLGKLGEKLVALHLMKSPDLNNPIARFQGQGDREIEKPVYKQEEERVYINKTQYFEGVPKEVWEYMIGGYQVCHKWLKDRKGRTLNHEDIKHYCRIVTALKKTIELQKELDRLYPQIEENVIES